MHGPGALLAERYRLDERVGGGGMGEVWRATDQVLARTVAVKVMRPELLEEPGFADRFLVEARTMATIRHRGVVAVHDYRTDAAGTFLVMEYVEGESLARRLHRFGTLDPVRTMTLVAQAADALQAAHDRSVVHRDIKPGNLLVTADDQLVLTDFGIARSAASTPLTATGAVIGTPSYLAPEQVLGKPATPVSDLYSLGVVAYECLAGHRPFPGENPFEIAMKRLREPPPTLTVEAPRAVLAVVERALATDPQQRWPSAAELAAAARRSVAPPSTTLSAPDTGPPETEPAATEPAEARPADAGPPDGGPPPAEEVGFAPARAPVPEPARPVTRTAIEQSSPVPPASPPPAGPHPAGTHPAGPHPSPPPAAPPWPPQPGRPVTVLLASLALGFAALGLFVYSAASALALRRVVAVARQVYGPDFDDVRGLSVAAGWLAVGTLGLLSLLFLLLATQVLKGSGGARAWSYVLGIVVLCCCAPGWWFADSDRVAEDPGTAEFVRAVAAGLPWYSPLVGQAVLLTTVALLLALVLLVVPPTNRFFRAVRARPHPGYYYPYYYPYYYGYPPRR